MADKGFFFDTDKFLSSTDVSMMEADEVGGYVLLLAHMWNRDCSLPDDDAVLCKLARLTPKRWKAGAGANIRKCMMPHPTKPGMLTNPTLFEKWERYERYLAEQSAKGKASAAKRANRNGTTVEPRLNIGSTGVPTGDPTEGQLQSDKVTKNTPLPPFEEPTDPDDRLKFLLERKVARLSALPWGNLAQEERARETLTALHADVGEAAAVERLVAAYRWRGGAKTYQAPASVPDVLYRLSKMEETAADEADDAPAVPEKIWTVEELRARARR